MEIEFEDCAFQYATGDGNTVKDTDLISRKAADKLWEEHLDLFHTDFKAGKTPEMAVCL